MPLRLHTKIYCSFILMFQHHSDYILMYILLIDPVGYFFLKMQGPFSPLDNRGLSGKIARNATLAETHFFLYISPFHQSYID